MTLRRLAVLVRKVQSDPTSLTAQMSGAPEYTVTEFLLADLRQLLSNDQIKNPWRARASVTRRSARAGLARERARAYAARKAEKSRPTRG